MSAMVLRKSVQFEYSFIKQYKKTYDIGTIS